MNIIKRKLKKEKDVFFKQLSGTVFLSRRNAASDE